MCPFATGKKFWLFLVRDCGVRLMVCSELDQWYPFVCIRECIEIWNSIRSYNFRESTPSWDRICFIISLSGICNHQTSTTSLCFDWSAPQPIRRRLEGRSQKWGLEPGSIGGWSFVLPWEISSMDLSYSGSHQEERENFRLSKLLAAEYGAIQQLF